MTEQESNQTQLSSPALFCLSKAKENQGVKILVSSPSFRTSKDIFREIEREIQKIGNHSEIKRDSDMMSIKIGESFITAIPASNKGHLRGYRFDVIVLNDYEIIPSSVMEEIKEYSKVNSSEIIFFT